MRTKKKSMHNGPLRKSRFCPNINCRSPTPFGHTGKDLPKFLALLAILLPGFVCALIGFMDAPNAHALGNVLLLSCGWGEPGDVLRMDGSFEAFEGKPRRREKCRTPTIQMSQN